MTSQRHRILCSDTSCAIHDHIKNIFDVCDQDRCVTRRSACLSRRHIKSPRSSVISRNTSPRTFPSTEKVFRRAALTLLRRNHAARVAGARRHSVPIRSCGCRSATWFENPRIPRFAPDTRGVPPQCCSCIQNYNCWLLLVILGRFRDPRKRAKKGLFLGSSKTTLFSRFLVLLITLLHHQIIIITSTHHQLTSSHHIIKLFNSQRHRKSRF